MKNFNRNILLLTCFLSTTTLGISQEKSSKEKMNEYDEVIIKKKNDKDAKVILEIKDGIITANGKPLEDFEDETLSIRRRKTRIITTVPDARFRIQEGRGMPLFDQPLDGPTNQNKAFLGVLTKEVENGVEILEVTAESGAEKAGLKSGDIILKVDADKINTPEDLVKSIGRYKPEDNVVITYKRGGKDAKTNVQLGKNNSQNRVYEFKRETPKGNDFKEKLDDFNFDLRDLPNMGDMNFNWKGQGMPPFGAKPKLGIKIQDLESGKGVKVLEVEKESPAEKAGLKAEDVITNLNDKSVDNTDALLEQIRTSKDLPTIKMQISRDGKTQNVEIKIPKKLKTANL